MFEITQANPTNTAIQAFSVSEINTLVADVLAGGLPGSLWVEGEISNLSLAASGHRYFSLKDSQATISCALFKNNANRINRDILQALSHGDKVIVKASLNVYKPQGRYQLIISDLEPAGFGALAKAFVLLKNKLEKAGFFASERKRPIPSWPRGIAVITSATGAAISDVLTTLKRRAPFIPITVYPTLVQGEKAPAEIINALNQAGQNTAVNLVLLVRGGGSLEDLMAFNDEQVAMAVAQCKHPVITGVGHETDFSIVDFISDYRAATPTAAAEVASPNKAELQQRLNRHQQRLYLGIKQISIQKNNQLNVLKKRLSVQHPRQRLQQQNQSLDELSKRLVQKVTHLSIAEQQQLKHLHHRLLNSSPQYRLLQSKQQFIQLKGQVQLNAQRRINTERQRLEQTEKRLKQSLKLFEKHEQQLKGLQARLSLLSPLGVLDRGYAIAFDSEKRPLRSIKQAYIGQTLTIQLADGHFKVTVKEPSP